MTPQCLVLHVDLQSGCYPIYIGTNLFSEKIIGAHIRHEQVLIVTNETVAPLYLKPLKDSLRHYVCDEVILPDGEQYKTLTTLNSIFDQLIIKQHRRNTTLIALGGGVIGDMTGFAAACYQRGVDFIQIPTTLLAQVDASVGGKTAINHPLAKNLIGAFYQPKAVIIDMATLSTLPDREFRSGLAEIIKAALIADYEFFEWLEKYVEKLANKENSYLVNSIRRAIEIKIDIVKQDEREANVRALLNLGHTFAHGIERSLGYGTWLHGEAVSLGLVLAADLSSRLGFINSAIVDRIKNILTITKLPIRLPSSLSADELITAMQTDKKKETAELKLVLLKGIGQPVIISRVDPSLVLETIRHLQ